MTTNVSNNRDKEETAEKLATGLLSIYYPTLKHVKGQLLELTKKQEILYNELHIESIKFAEARFCVELQDMFKKIKLYKKKVADIKLNMMMIYEQGTRLKKRALKLEQQKQKEALEKVQQRENEELLIGKPHSSSLT